MTRAMRRQETGFSLVEALVALVVLSVSAGTLLASVERYTNNIGAIADRATALWIAENRLVEMRLGLGDLPSVERATGRSWWVFVERKDTSDPDLLRVEISVGPGADDDAVLAQLAGFIDRESTAK